MRQHLVGAGTSLKQKIKDFSYVIKGYVELESVQNLMLEKTDDLIKAHKEIIESLSKKLNNYTE